MATDMAVNTATWGTASLLLASGDAIDGATGFGWGSQVAKNTGFLYYQPRQAAWSRHINEAGTDIQPIYLTAGVYSFYGIIAFNNGGTGTVLVDGSVVVAGEGKSGNITGSKCGWTVATTGWYNVTTYYVADDGTTNTVNAAVAYRFGSWAP